MVNNKALKTLTIVESEGNRLVLNQRRQSWILDSFIANLLCNLPSGCEGTIWLQLFLTKEQINSILSFITTINRARSKTLSFCLNRRNLSKLKEYSVNAELLLQFTSKSKIVLQDKSFKEEFMSYQAKASKMNKILWQILIVGQNTNHIFLLMDFYTSIKATFQNNSCLKKIYQMFSSFSHRRVICSIPHSDYTSRPKVPKISGEQAILKVGLMKIKNTA